MPTTRFPRQDSTANQLRDVAVIAVREGCYDAHDVIKRLLVDQPEDLVYFYMDFHDAVIATEAIWALEDALGRDHTSFAFAGVGSDASVWTKSPSGQRLLRATIVHMAIAFSEGPTEQRATKTAAEFR